VMIWSNEAEQSVLGALMLEPMAWDKLQDISITESDFYEGRHRLIFSAISELSNAGKPVDVVTLAETMDDSNKLADAGGADYLAWLVDATPTIENVAAYGEIVVERSRKRQYQQVGLSIGDMIESGGDVLEIEGHIATELARISTGGSKTTVMSAKQAAAALIARLERDGDEDGPQMTTGIPDLDALYRPEKGRLTVIAGRPGMGKSTLAGNIAEANATGDNQIPALVMTMEMPHEEQASRFVASMGRVESEFLRSPKAFANPDDQWPKLAAGVTMFKDSLIDIDYCPGTDANQLRSKIRSWCRMQPVYQERGDALVVIDYLGLIKLSGASNRVHELGAVTKMLKTLAGELGIAIILLHQLNRGLEQRPDKRPQMSDLRDSGEIEEDADTIVFIYRDEVYKEDSPEKGIAEILVRKNRGGSLGQIRCSARLNHYRFEQLARGY